MKKEYGTKQWFEAEYVRTEDDPWGLSWRPSQAVRYQIMWDVLEKFVPKMKCSVLDCGCATGDFTFGMAQHFRSYDWNIIGIDFSEEAISRARQRFPPMTFETYTIANAQEKYAGNMDVVTCLEVLYYLDHEGRRDMIARISSILKSGGFVLFSSMIAKPPYLSKEELVNLVSQEFSIVQTGKIYAKPISILEKIILKAIKTIKLLGYGRKISPGKVVGKVIGNDRAMWWENKNREWVPSMSASHVYVLARKQ